MVETSEELISDRELTWLLRSLGERGLISAAAAVLVARPPASNLHRLPSALDRATYRADQCTAALDTIRGYNPHAVVCLGVPFGHTRPQWILPYGGHVTVDGRNRRIWADYGGRRADQPASGRRRPGRLGSLRIRRGCQRSR